MSDILANLKKNGVVVQEFNLTNEVGLEYWHTLFIQNGKPISGGFGSAKDYSRKVAYSEFLERSKYRSIWHSSDESRKEWGLDLIPTACGFAAGFDKSNTINRSLGEAIERWTMSKWIDEQFYIDEVQPSFPDNIDGKVCKWFVEQFDKVLFFEKEVVVQFQGEFVRVKVAQTMGIKGSGIYPGSSAQVHNGNIWTHALLESYRHLLIVKNGADFSIFPNDKVKFFSENSRIALRAISLATEKSWPLPEVKFFNTQYFPDESFYLSRVIIEGWKSWDTGPIERFLY